jgi:serine phosphatase RsbU (regulator of sigma subunit)
MDKKLEENIRQFIKKENITLEDFEKLIKDYSKQTKRFDKILKQSDKQQNLLLKLNEELEEKERQIRELYEYDYSQQMVAKNKVEAGLINELEFDDEFMYKVVFLASDILSGDFYSIFRKENRIVYYVIDGQGHGVSPALTVFSVASIFRDKIGNTSSLEELLNYMITYIKAVLLDSEQLSFTFIELDFDKNQLNYAIGGMYPTYLKDKNGITKIKANNLPILNFTDSLNIDTIEFEDFDSILSYTDGIIENEIVQKFHPKKLIENPELINELEVIEDKYKDDDITLVYIKKLDL